MLALKYKVQHVVDSALLRLRERFPSTSLAQWDDTTNDKPIIMDNIDCIAVVVLARACNALDVLPLAFYGCCSLDLSTIFDGASYGGEKVQLSSSDLRQCLVGHRLLVELNQTFITTILELCAGSRPGRACHRPHPCHTALCQILAKCSYDGFFCDPGCLEEMISYLVGKDAGPSASKVCSACKKRIQEAERNFREEAFLKLGTIFGVEDWPTVSER